MPGWAGVALGALLLAYVGARAVLLSFTHDEGLTYNFHVRAGFWATVSYSQQFRANNHLLNSLLAGVSSAVLGAGEWALRLPNVAAAAGLVLAARGLLQRVSSRVVQVCGLALMVLHPFLLDFFSLCRGYGLGVALLMGSLWMLVRHVESRRSRHHGVLAVALAALAATATLPLLVPLCVVTALVLASSAWRARPRGWRAVAADCAPSLGLSALFLAGLVPLGMWLRKLGALYAGFPTLGQSAQALWQSVLYERPDSWHLQERLTTASLAVLVLGSAVGVMLLRRKPRRYRRLAVVCGVLWAWMAAAVMQHHLLGTLYPEPRMLVTVLPILALTLALLVDGLAQLLPARAPRHLPGLALVPLALLVVMHAAAAANFTHTHTWRYDAGTRAMMDALVADVEASGRQGPVVLAVSSNLEPSASYYRLTRGLTWLQPVTRDGLRHPADYAITLPNQRHKDPVRRLAQHAISGQELGVASPPTLPGVRPGSPGPP